MPTTSAPLSTALRSPAITTALVAVAFIAVNAASFDLATVSGEPIVWFPAGVAVAAMVGLDRRVAALGLGVGGLATSLALGEPIASAIGAVTTMIGAGWVGAVVLDKIAPERRTDLDTVFAMAAAAISAGAATAVGGALTTALFDWSTLAETASPVLALRWVSATALAVMVVLPPAVLPRNAEPAPSMWRLIEAAGVSVTLIGAGWWVFLIGSSQPYPVAVPLMWVTFRFHPRDAAWTILGITLVAAMGTSMGIGPFIAVSLFELDVFFMLVSFGGLGLSVSLFERSNAVAGSIASAGQLESRAHELEVALDSLGRSEERFRLIFENAPLGVGLIGLDGRYTRVNAKLCELLGRPASDIVGADAFGFVHPDERDLAEASRQRLVLGQARTARIDRRIIRPDGSSIHASIHSVLQHDADGRPLHLLSLMEDVTAHRETEARLAHLAMHDSLTGLPNRALMIDRLIVALSQMKRDPDRQVALLFVDLDRFKLLNDSLGHEVGDQVLVEIAERLRGSMRSSDTVARFGGDEFVILCQPVSDVGEASRLADRITEALATPFTVAGREMRLSGSVGIAMATDPDVTADDLLRNADAAMYLAKDRGRARSALYDDDLHRTTTRRMEVEQDLRRAIEEDELELHYQPQISLIDDRVVGVEALVRWQHPVRGLLTPASFIEVAEETGIIDDIGAWVTEQAVRQAAQWRCGHADAQIPKIAINVSAAELLAGNTTIRLVDLLDRCSVPGRAIEVEVTERVVMDDVRAAMSAINALGDLGVSVGIDDFGTGYSSLSYLKDLPLSFLKVDRAFVSSAASNRRTAGTGTLAAAIVRLAHSLGLIAIAEGIETSHQAESLRDLGCDAGQGFLIAHPMPASDISRWLDDFQRATPLET